MDNKPLNRLSDKYTPTGKELDLREWVYDRYQAMKANPKRKTAEQAWTQGRKQWESIRKGRWKEEPSEEWQSDHYVPLTTAIIETALSEIIDPSPRPLILPRGLEDVPKATIMSKIYDFTWEIGDADLELEDIVHDALICGTGIGQEYFWKDVRKIKTNLKKGSKLEYDDENQTDYDDCFLESVRLEDFFIDELARGFHGPYRARDCIRRYIMDIKAFQQFFQGSTWNPLGNAKYVQPGGDTNYYEKYTPPDGIDHSKQVEVLWYWSIAPEDLLVIVANDVVVMAGPNPYKHKELPFARAIDIKRTHDFYGKGEAELLESIQDETNTLRRMIIDRNHLDIDKMFYGTSLVNISDEDLIARPHGFIPAEGEIRPIEYNDVPRSVELSLQHLEDDATITTGINPRAQALPTTGTATEAAILKESTLKRIRLKVRRLERECLTRVARLRVSNILQFYPQPKLEQIVGEEATKEFKDEIQQLQQKGVNETKNLIKVGQQTFKKSFRNIRLENQEFIPNPQTGQFELQSSTKQFTFFPIKPEYYLPAKGAYDIKFTAGSTLPISKPLLQTKKSEMFDRLLPLAEAGVYDLKKLGDNLLKANDENPSDYSKDQPAVDESEQRLQMALDLANMENKMMMQGKAVPATPYAPPGHTAIHVEFMKSGPFQQLQGQDPRVQIFSDHVTGELFAQQNREAGGMQPGALGAPTANGQAPQAPPMSEVMPGKVTGGQQVQQQNPVF